MIKIKGEHLINDRLDSPVSLREFEALARRVTLLEARNVTVVTADNALRNGKSNADRQRAYRERKRG